MQVGLHHSSILSQKQCLCFFSCKTVFLYRKKKNSQILFVCSRYYHLQMKLTAKWSRKKTLHSKHFFWQKQVVEVHDLCGGNKQSQTKKPIDHASSRYTRVWSKKDSYQIFFLQNSITIYFKDKDAELEALNKHSNFAGPWEFQILAFIMPKFKLLIQHFCL